MTIFIFALILIVAFVPAALGWIFLKRYWQKRGLSLSPVFTVIFFAGGIASLVIAAFVQAFLPLEIPAFDGSSISGRAAILTFYSLRTAFVEEAARFAVLTSLFAINNRLLRKSMEIYSNFSSLQAENGIIYNSGGLLAGLSFATLETAAHAATESGALLVRAISAAPLHGACGIRCAQSIELFNEKRRVAAAGRFVYAAALHSFYNIMIVRGGIFSILSIILAITALISSFRRR